MKKVIITLIAAVATVGFAFGQTPANGNMESWTSSGTFEDPDSWGSLNIFSTIAPGFPIGTEKTTDSHAGQFAAKLTTLAGDPDFTAIPSLAQVFTKDTFPGLMLLGNLALGSIGAPFNQRPTALNFWYKYTSVGGDSAGVLISLTRFDSNTNQQVIVGQGLASINATVGTYTLGDLTINYVDNANPDSVSIIAFSSYNALALLGNQIPTAPPIPGSTLFIDDFSILTTAVGENEAGKFDFKMFPNPVSDELSILCNGHQFANNPINVEFYDMTGRRVQSFNVTQMISKADVSGLASGMYIYAVKNGNTVLRTGKFTVAK
jgi:hypothetical protein